MLRTPLSIYMVCGLVLLLNMLPLTLALPVALTPNLTVPFRVFTLVNYLTHFFSIGFVLRYFLHKRRWAMFSVLAILLGNALYYLNTLAIMSKKNTLSVAHSNKLTLLFACFVLNLLCGILVCSQSCQSFFKRGSCRRFCQHLQQASLLYAHSQTNAAIPTV
jgi:hypothetical protein